MKTILSLVASVALAVSAAPSARAADGPVKYQFRAPPVNALGVAGLEDLRGKPVLIDFWGTR